MLAMNVPEFCKAVGISKRTFWNLNKTGSGPAVCRIGRRVVIRLEAADDWLKRMETAVGIERAE